ncbi:MAG: integrase arm-type DNA-binding domain-containing protein [Gammaproteobacteria bacterium]|nr:integrase arm-type DNA-binding domain-containing protein [Gammaproteobacteria bacterium]
MHELTVAQTKNAKAKAKPWKLADGAGLYLLIKPAGSKYWRFDYRFEGKRKTLSLGVYPEVSLKRARQKHREARDLLDHNLDPSVERKDRQSRKTDADTFKVIARDWFNRHVVGKSPDHVNRTMNALERDLIPYLGDKPVGSITAPELMSALNRVESRGTYDTARRTRSTASRVFKHAMLLGHATLDPAAALADALTPPKRKHFAAITEPDEVSRLLKAIDGFTGTPVVHAALRISALLFQRPGEIRAMQWNEINWEQRRWEIPAEKMKMRQPHIVPLSSQALQILKEIWPLTSRSQYVFPGARGNSRCLSENAIRTALRDLGYDNDTMTAHGFRALARTLLDEVLGYGPDLIEHQLAHAVHGPLGRAYNRTTHLEARTGMMQAWADYLDRLREVVVGGTNEPNPVEDVGKIAAG